MTRFVNEYYSQPKRGYGMNVVDVFRALRDSKFEDVFLPAKLQFNGSGSYGNGAAMRIAPIALFGNHRGEEYIMVIIVLSYLSFLICCVLNVRFC